MHTSEANANALGSTHAHALEQAEISGENYIFDETELDKTAKDRTLHKDGYCVQTPRLQRIWIIQTRPPYPMMVSEDYWGNAGPACEVH